MKIRVVKDGVVEGSAFVTNEEGQPVECADELAQAAIDAGLAEAVSVETGKKRGTDPA